MQPSSARTERFTLATPAALMASPPRCVSREYPSMRNISQFQLLPPGIAPPRDLKSTEEWNTCAEFSKWTHALLEGQWRQQEKEQS